MLKLLVFVHLAVPGAPPAGDDVPGRGAVHGAPEEGAAGVAAAACAHTHTSSNISFFIPIHLRSGYAPALRRRTRYTSPAVLAATAELWAEHDCRIGHWTCYTL